MTFRTGFQASIGNGSTLVLVGTRPMEDDVADDFYQASGSWVELIAHIEAEKTPPGMDQATLIQKHARAFWKDACVCWFNVDKAKILTQPTQPWARVLYTDSVEGDLRNPKKYLHAEAARQSDIWQMIEYACFGGAAANQVLGIHNTITDHMVKPRQRILPIQPNRLSGLISGNPCEGPGEKNYENLSFGLGGAAEKAAQTLCKAYVGHGSWAGLRKGWSEWFASRGNISLEELQEGLSQLLRDDFIKQDPNDPLYELEIRESLVVKFWEAAVDV